MRFLNYFPKETEECDQENLNVSDTFGTTTPCLATYSLEVGARFSLKIATKTSLRGKKTQIFRVKVTLKQKRSSVTKITEVCKRFGIIIPCLATYFLEVGARVSLKVEKRGKKNS